jgi:hypothetical protein
MRLITGGIMDTYLEQLLDPAELVPVIPWYRRFPSSQPVSLIPLILRFRLVSRYCPGPCSSAVSRQRGARLNLS